jgi:hypothetical protein
MTDKEAMKLALEALELLTGAWQTFDALDYGDNAITALKERLAQPEQERDEILQAITDPENQPSQFGTVTLEYHQEKMKMWEDLFDRMHANFERASDKVIAQRTEQEPVAWITPNGEGFRIRFSPPTNDVPPGWDALYTHPPQRTELLIGCVNHDCDKCKPLTKEQRQELMSKAWNKWLSNKDDGRLFAWDFSFEVEAAHGIKENT